MPSPTFSVGMEQKKELAGFGIKPVHMVGFPSVAPHACPSEICCGVSQLWIPRFGLDVVYLKTAWSKSNASEGETTIAARCTLIQRFNREQNFSVCIHSVLSIIILGHSEFLDSDFTISPYCDYTFSFAAL